MSGRPKSNLRIAISAILFACFIYAILSAVVKLELSHLSVPGILFWRYLTSLFLFVPWMLYKTRNTTLNLKPTSFKLYWVRTIAILASIYFYCAALKTLSVALTSLLFNILPLFVPLVARIWKKVPINHQLWWGFFVALIGVGFVINPHQIEWNGDMLFAIGAGLCGAFSLVALRFSHYEESAYRINFYFFLFAFVITVPMTFWNVESSWIALKTTDILPLIAIGVTGFLYQQSFSLALKNGPARFLAPFMYTTVIWGSLLDWWFWNTTFTAMRWFGIGLVIAGNILIYLLYPKKDLTS